MRLKVRFRNTPTEEVKSPDLLLTGPRNAGQAVSPQKGGPPSPGTLEQETESESGREGSPSHLDGVWAELTGLLQAQG